MQIFSFSFPEVLASIARRGTISYFAISGILFEVILVSPSSHHVYRYGGLLTLFALS